MSKLQAKQEEIIKKQNSLVIQDEELEHLKVNMNDYPGRKKTTGEKAKDSIAKQIKDIRESEHHRFSGKNNRDIER